MNDRSPVTSSDYFATRLLVDPDLRAAWKRRVILARSAKNNPTNVRALVCGFLADMGIGATYAEIAQSLKNKTLPDATPDADALRATRDLQCNGELRSKFLEAARKGVENAHTRKSRTGSKNSEPFSEFLSRYGYATNSGKFAVALGNSLGSLLARQSGIYGNVQLGSPNGGLSPGPTLIIWPPGKVVFNEMEIIEPIYDDTTATLKWTADSGNDNDVTLEFSCTTGKIREGSYSGPRMEGAIKYSDVAEPQAVFVREGMATQEYPPSVGSEVLAKIAGVEVLRKLAKVAVLVNWFYRTAPPAAR
ncbi:hypothetical protein ACH429_25575 [Streptomyces pathocidini]|uniref:Uncharacterized protein n=1 Tax=Streptomyces pathocidini TaxID=1650571 RepID=A0ABW7UXX0_9ACTN|nr:hypothetical protein [Streptomyces pathocidini]